MKFMLFLKPAPTFVYLLEPLKILLKMLLMIDNKHHTGVPLSMKDAESIGKMHNYKVANACWRNKSDG